MVTTLPLQQGKISITSGTFTGPTRVLCEIDGGVKLIWNDDTETTFLMTAGQEAFSYEAKAVVVNTGTFTLASV